MVYRLVHGCIARGANLEAVVETERLTKDFGGGRGVFDLDPPGVHLGGLAVLGSLTVALVSAAVAGFARRDLRG